ncbi:MAG: winged helix-turn-helix domain-containing protein [Methanoregula sp.]
MKSKPKKASSSKTARMAKIVNNQFDSVNRNILKIISERKEISIQDLAVEIDLNPKNVAVRANKLQDEGLIIKYKGSKNNKAFVKWVGGVPALEDDLESSTKNHITGALLVESYDSMICDPFSPFSLIFENHCWEVIENFAEGLNDLELSQRLGKATSLDTIRRIMIISSTHNIISIKTIRNSAGKDISALFEPLYKIEKVNKQYMQYLTLIRGLASAMSYKLEGKASDNSIHPFAPILDLNEQIFELFSDIVLSVKQPEDRDILTKSLKNYDFAQDLDRLYKQENWRLKLKNSSVVSLDSKSDNIIISKDFFNDSKNKILKGMK